MLVNQLVLTHFPVASLRILKEDEKRPFMEEAERLRQVKENLELENSHTFSSLSFLSFAFSIIHLP